MCPRVVHGDRMGLVLGLGLGRGNDQVTVGVVDRDQVLVQRS